MEECLSASSNGLKSASKAEFGFETLAETEILDQRMKWEALAFNAFPTDTPTLKAYLYRLFKLSRVISKAHLRVQKLTAAFEEKLAGGKHFDDKSMAWVINGLLRGDLLTEEKR